jgi:hypothetical protein
MIEPAHVVALPKGQCFALIEGGQLNKIRVPLPKPDPDEKLSSDLQEMVVSMRSRVRQEEDWWQGDEIGADEQDGQIPADLVEEDVSANP